MRDPVYDLAWLRFVVAVVLVLSIGALVKVCFLYWRAYRGMPATDAGRAAGLLPLHVALVSFGVLLLEVALAWGLIEQLRVEATASVAIRTVLYGAGAVAILIALGVVANLQRRKVFFGRGCTRITVDDSQRTQVKLDPSEGG